MMNFHLTIDGGKILSCTESNILFQDETYLLIGKIRSFQNIQLNHIFISKFLGNPIDFLDAFDAEYGLCLMLKKEKKLYLFRDKMGIKGIYYSIENNSIYISSNVFNVLSKKQFKKFSPIGVLQYLLFEYIKDPITLFEDVYSLERGQLIEIDLKNIQGIQKTYFRKKLYAFDELDTPNTEYISKHLRHLIINAHEKRSSSNNSILLSGGIDSTVMAITLKNDLQDQNLEALTFDTIGAEQSELAYAEFVAKKLDLKHHIIKVDPFKDVDLFNLIDRSNFPYIGTMMLNASMEKVDNNIKYNFFAGQDTRLHTPAIHQMDLLYFKYFKNRFINMQIQKTSEAFRFFIKINNKIKQKIYSRLQSFDNFQLYILQNLFHYHSNSILLKTRNDYISDNIIKLAESLTVKKNGSLRRFYNSIVEIAWGWQYDDDIAYMMNNIEHFGFLCSMPFYDIKLAEFSATLPMRLSLKKTKGRSGYGNQMKKVNKFLLRQAYKYDLPDEIIFRDKAVAITNHIYLNTVMKKYIDEFFPHPKLKTTEAYEQLQLSSLYALALKNNGKWRIEDYTTVVEIHNLLFLELIARKYEITN